MVFLLVSTFKDEMLQESREKLLKIFENVIE